MTRPCRVCQVTFTPTPHQLKKKDYLCVSCNRAYQKHWRTQRTAEGKPARGAAPPPEWWKQYRAKYYAKPEVKAAKAAHMRRYANDPRLRHKHEARWITRRAIASGHLKRQPCERCGSSPTHAHHKDYSRPFDVAWLCPPCHRTEHRGAKAEGRQS